LDSQVSAAGLIHCGPASLAQAALVAMQAGGDGANIGDFTRAPTAKADVTEARVNPRPMAAARRRRVMRDERAFAFMAMFLDARARHARPYPSASYAKFFRPDVIFLTLSTARNRLVFAAI
jgi:hypothetical protein